MAMKTTVFIGNLQEIKLKKICNLTSLRWTNLEKTGSEMWKLKDNNFSFLVHILDHFR